MAGVVRFGVRDASSSRRFRHRCRGEVRALRRGAIFLSPGTDWRQRERQRAKLGRDMKGQLRRAGANKAASTGRPTTNNNVIEQARTRKIRNACAIKAEHW